MVGHDKTEYSSGNYRETPATNCVATRSLSADNSRDAIGNSNGDGNGSVPPLCSLHERAAGAGGSSRPVPALRRCFHMPGIAEFARRIGREQHKFDFKKETAYASGSMKAIWDNIRAIDGPQSGPA
jgi:hypothetical protein